MKHRPIIVKGELFSTEMGAVRKSVGKNIRFKIYISFVKEGKEKRMVRDRREVKESDRNLEHKRIIKIIYIVIE